MHSFRSVHELGKRRRSALVTLLPCGLRVAPVLRVASPMKKGYVNVCASGACTTKSVGLETRCVAHQNQRSCRSLN